MVIEILGKKYNCGSNRGMSKTDMKGILQMLNTVIEWDQCKFPYKLKDGGDPEKKEDYEENRSYLDGEDGPILSPGDMFIYNGNIFAIDNPDTLILGISETGYGACDRFVKEILIPEFDLYNNFDVDKLVFELSDSEKITDKFDIFKPKYETMKFINDRIRPGRYDKNAYLKITVEESDLLPFPVEFYMGQWAIYYNHDIIDKESISDITNGIFGWFYRELDRMKITQPKALPEEGEDDTLAEDID